MNELWSYALVVTAGTLLAYPALRAERPRIARIAATSLALHYLAVALQVEITRGVYGGGDMLGYFRLGGQLSRLLSYDLGRFGPEVLRLALQLEPSLPFHVVGTGNAMGTMAAIAGGLHYALAGSLYGAAAAIATIAFFGKLALYRALTLDADEAHHPALAVAVLLAPSVIFWSSGLLKESVVIGPLGFLYAACRSILAERRMRALPVALGAALMVALAKPYILFAFVVGAGAYLYGEQARRAGRSATLRPGAVVVSAALVGAAVLGLGRLYPSFALENLAAAAAHQQAMGAMVRGGSSYAIGDPMATTLGEQLAFAPWAVVTSLYRPFVFEARTALSLVSSFEVTVALALSVRMLWRARPVGLLRDVMASPMLLFCVAFTFAMALPVGLSTTNLGTLVRYRMPLLPFYFVALFVFNARRVRAPRAQDGGG